MDGLAFVRELRATPAGEAPVVIFCTVENDPEHITLALESGADEYIMKPFAKEIVEAKFQRVGFG